MPKISIIVPVYNVEAYLGRCIDSILSQSFSDFEAILVDDGSTDESGRMCDEYSKLDSRIKVVHKKNGGVSSARNVGLEYANGEYIAFCDSDDLLTDVALETAIGLYSKEGVNLVNFGYRFLSKKQAVTHDLQQFCEIKSFNQKKEYMIDLARTYGWEVWSYMFKKDIIIKNNIRFCESCGNFAEDLGFTLEYLLYTDGIVRTTEQLYVYDDTRDSSMMNRSKKQYKFNEVNEVSQHVQKAFQQKFMNGDFVEIHHYIVLNQGIKLWNDLKTIPKLSLKDIFDSVENKEFFFSNNIAFARGNYGHRRRNPLTNYRDDVISEFLAYKNEKQLLSRARLIYPIYVFGKTVIKPFLK